MVNQKLGFITVAICFGYITTLTGLFCQSRRLAALYSMASNCYLSTFYCV